MGNDPDFRTKLRVGAELAAQAHDAGLAFRAVAADSAYGDQAGFRCELADSGLPFVMALRPRHGIRARADQAHTPVDAARVLTWGGTRDPGDWHAVIRTFRDGHTEIWWAADATLGWWGPDGTTRLVVVTADPATLPAKATWYLATNLPRLGGPREDDAPYPAADLNEIVRIHGIRHWIEQSYKQVEDELGRADFQVRSDIAIRRHQTLVNCAFSFCWDAWFTEPDPTPAPVPQPCDDTGERGTRNHPTAPIPILATGDPGRPRLDNPLDRAATLLAVLVERAPTHPVTGPHELGWSRPRPAPLSPEPTNHR
ncbi:transposase [Embleya sp. NPDC059259]|uniref:IS701 family transposase n=1 Tax=unclassified Embleya TaxID=2699296 RepID=UPI0036861E07